ncbi:hypothetical protein FRC07_011818, partial [Ceratobasidium sp. 392]
MSQLGIDGVQKIDHELRSICAAFKAVNNLNRNNSYRKAEIQLQALEILDRRIDYIHKIAKTKVQLKDTAIQLDDQ